MEANIGRAYWDYEVNNIADSQQLWATAEQEYKCAATHLQCRIRLQLMIYHWSIDIVLMTTS